MGGQVLRFVSENKYIFFLQDGSIPLFSAIFAGTAPALMPTLPEQAASDILIEFACQHAAGRLFRPNLPDGSRSLDRNEAPGRGFASGAPRRRSRESYRR